MSEWILRLGVGFMIVIEILWGIRLGEALGFDPLLSIIAGVGLVVFRFIFYPVALDVILRWITDV